MKKHPLFYPLILLFLGLLFFFPGLGAIHLFDWDEINFAEISREMILTENYSQVFINFQPFWEKPPFFFWLQVLSMKAFGINEFAARFPNAICGLLTLVLIFFIGKNHYNQRFGFIWGLVYFGSILPHLYFRSGIIDPVFNLFIFLGLYGLIVSFWKKEAWAPAIFQRHSLLYLILGGLLLGLAVLTKGPAALVIVGLCVVIYWLFEKCRWYLPFSHFLLYGLCASLLTLLWFGLETYKNGTWFVQEFVDYQIRLFSTPVAGHQGFTGYHFVVLLIGCFPASIFALAALFEKSKEEEQAYQKDFSRWMKILFWVVLILFSIVQSKIVHYSSLCYFPLTYLAATKIQDIIAHPDRLKTWMKVGLSFIATIFAFAIFLTPYLLKNPEILTPYIDDSAEMSLRAEFSWTGLEILPGVLMLLLLIVFLAMVRKSSFRAFTFLFIGNACFIFLTLYFFIHKIQSISQGPAIEFWELHSGEEVYCDSYEFKSYAPLFYSKKPADSHPQSFRADWLLTGDIDRPVYLACKVNRAEKLAKVPGFQEVSRKNDFVFFLRKPK